MTNTAVYLHELYQLVNSNQNTLHTLHYAFLFDENFPRYLYDIAVTLVQDKQNDLLIIQTMIKLAENEIFI